MKSTNFRHIMVGLMGWKAGDSARSSKQNVQWRFLWGCLLPQHRLRLMPSAAPAAPAVPVVRVVRAVPVVPAGGQVVAMVVPVARAGDQVAAMVDPEIRAGGQVVVMVVREVGRVVRAGAVALIAARMAVCGGGVTGMMAAVFLWITGAVIVACMRRHRVIAGLTTAAAFCWRLWPRVLFPMSLRGVSIR